MANITTRERPGVYSYYDAASIINGGSGARVVGLAAAAETGTAMQANTITSYAGGMQLYGQGSRDCPMTELLRLLFLNGATSVVAVPAAVGAAAQTEDFKEAFQVLAEQEGLDIMVCGSGDAEVLGLLKESITTADSTAGERIGVVGMALSGTEELIQAAAEMNCERMVLVGPQAVNADGETISGFYLAAAVAGVIAGETDPAVPLNGAHVLGFGGLEKKFNENEIDLLVRGGVTPVETAAGAMSVVRGVTTRTTTNGAADITWRELTTILIVDDVIPAVRDSLKARFSRAKNTALTRSAIRSRVIMELEEKKNREIIDGYSNVTVTADETDATVCVVEFEFTVAHGLNQIHIYAHITV